MAKHKVSELTGALLDAAVAKASGMSVTLEGFGKLAHLASQCWNNDGEFDEERGDRSARFCPSTSWADGGPIIEREQICLVPPEMRPAPSDAWRAEMLGTLLARDQGGRDYAVAFAQTPLVAAMRAYVASRFGDEVEL